MNKELINKFLTEAIGECWHELEGKFEEVIWIYKCTKCGYKETEPVLNIHGWQNDFFTWIGFGKLWEWAGNQEWFPFFINGEFFGSCGGVSFNFARNFINPERFAIAIAEYLGYSE